MSLREQIKAAIISVTNTDLNPADINDDTNVVDLGIDSMSIVTLFLEVEKKLGIQVDETQLSPDLLESFGGLSTFFESQTT